MLKIHLLSAIRALLKNRSISLINILGLTIGLTAFLFIVSYLFYELSFDSFFPGSETVYRVNMDVKKGNEQFYHGTKTCRGIYFSCKNEVPGIEANGVAYFESCLMRYKEEHISDQRVLWVDDGFEKVFPFKMIQGTPDFTRSFTGIIAKSKVKALFGDENPIGKILSVNEGMPIEITGIYNDLPSNTHLTADYFISIKTWVHYNWISAGPDWNMNAYWNYVKLKPGTSVAKVEEALTKLVNANISQRDNDLQTARIFLQPLSDLHFIRGLEGELGSQTNQKSLFFLFIIAILTIIIAWINYANLSTALASKRADEIGMRKLIGASRYHIWVQAFIETILINIFSILVSLAIYQMLLKPFAHYFDLPFSQAFIPFRYIFFSLVGVSAIGVILSSIYNTLTLAGLNPFNGKSGVRQKRNFRQGMVIAQMALSIIFISTTLIVYKQIQFMKNADLGINFNQVITLSAPASLNADSTKRTKYLGFREDLLKYPEFKSVTSNLFTPGQEPRYGNNLFCRPDAGIRPSTLFFVNNGDDGLIETFGLKLLAGRNFSPIPSQNQRKVIINERSAKEFGFKNPEDAVGNYIAYNDRDSVRIEIIGVVADFHNEGMQKPIYPMIYNNGHPFEFGFYSVRLNTPNYKQALSRLKTVWETHYPSDPMNYVFADEYFFRQYQSEARFGKFYSMLTILSISIACLGLYGLILFYLGRKRKEISIRKVNGARIYEVVVLLNTHIFIWVCLAFVIAFPVAWYATHKWLQNFAYKTGLSWWVFAISGALALFIALLTVSWQSFKAATRNPVESLRYE